LDAIFQRHDKAYLSCQEKYETASGTAEEREKGLLKCQANPDRLLVDELLELQADQAKMRKLLADKNPKERDYAQRYMQWAIFWFKGKVSQFDLETYTGML